MYIRPSKIRYSQDSIGNHFRCGNHDGRSIGETLDDILSGRCTDEDIPMMTVIFRKGHRYTCDNRRLWVFRKAEELGMIDYGIKVVKGWVDPRKFTTKTGGATIRVRGDPGGRAWRKRTPSKRIERPRSIRYTQKPDKPIFPQGDIHAVIICKACSNYPGSTTIHSKELVPLVAHHDSVSLTLDESSMDTQDTPEASNITDIQRISSNDFKVSRIVMTSQTERADDKNSTVNVKTSSDVTATSRTRYTLLELATEDPRDIAGRIFIAFLVFVAIILGIVFAIKASI